MVGWPSFGLSAAHRVGMALERVAVVADPPADQRVAVLGALVGAFDVVVVPAGLALGATPTRRLAARLRERGSVLVRVAVPGGRRRSGDPATGADLHLRVADAAWEGLGRGHGHLRARRARIVLEGRRRGGRSRPLDLWLPGPDGSVVAVDAGPRAIPLHPPSPACDPDGTGHPDGPGQRRSGARRVGHGTDDLVGHPADGWSQQRVERPGDGGRVSTLPLVPGRSAS